MGWLKDLFNKNQPAQSKQTQYVDMLNGYVPIFSQFGDDIYVSDVVQQGLSCIVQEMKKLIPTHVRENGGDKISVNSNVQSILNTPNQLMTQADFLEKIVWQLFFNYNAFIIPTYYTWKEKDGTEKRHYTGLYPVAPVQVIFLEDASGVYYVEMTFVNNYKTTLRYSDVIHIRYNYSVNEYMGGDENGQPNHEALLKTLQLNNSLLEGVTSAMKSSFAINGVVKYQSLLDDGKTEKNLQELERKLKNSESGFLPLDLKAEYIPLTRQIALVDEATLKFIDEKILRNFGVPLCILTGDYTKPQYEAFYQKTLEPLIIAISQAFTRTLFTDRERSFGNKIVLYPEDLIFMSVEQKLEMVNLLGASGSMYENEKRVAFGLRPLPELEGVRMQSLNWVNVEYAQEYQTQTPGNNRLEGGKDE